MGKWLLILALLGFAWWLAYDAFHEHVPQPALQASKELSARALLPRNERVVFAAPMKEAPASLVSEKLAIDSAELRSQLDEQVPRRLYAEAARCYRGNHADDQRLDLSYRLHVVDGEVSVTDLKAIESTLDDAALERCIFERISAVKWRDQALPDLDEEDDLYMRVGGFGSQVASAEVTPTVGHP
jgi:hypothetical protein